MTVVRVALVLLLPTFGLGKAVGQPNLPMSSIPPETDPKLAGLIRALYSQNPLERAEAARSLQVPVEERQAELSSWSIPERLECQERMLPAVPFLIAMLGDGAALAWTTSDPRRDRVVEQTTPGRLARTALACCGRSAVVPLIDAMTDPRFKDDRLIQQQIRFTLNDITGFVEGRPYSDLEAMTPDDWRKWWAENKKNRLPGERVEWGSGTWLLLIFAALAVGCGLLLAGAAILDWWKPAKPTSSPNGGSGAAAERPRN